MDLEKIQCQLKSHIRQHQVLVQEMKKDPQNVEIQRKVQSLQAELTSLSEKQKLVVQQLKQNIQPKPEVQSSDQTFAQSFPPHVMIAGYEEAARRGYTAVPLSTFENHNSSVKSPGVENITVSRFASPMTMGVNIVRNPAPNTANTPRNRPPLAAKLATNITRNSIVHLKSEPTPARPVFKKPVMVTTGMQTVPSLKADTTRLKPILPRPEAKKPKVSMGVQTSKPVEPVTKQDPEKLNFLSTLGLITITKCREILSQKHERKRRTSAIFSPYSSFQFFEPEPKKSATGQGIKRGRGRPPKNNEDNVKSPSVLSPVFEPVNGFKIPDAEALHNNKTSQRLSSPSPSKDEDHETNCAVCQLSGEVLMCDTCVLVYHLKCLSPPLTKIPPGMWMCPKCQRDKGNQASEETCKNKDPIEWPGTPAIVHSYLKHRAAKDKEKEQLLSRNHDLKVQELELQRKVNELSAAIMSQIQRKTEIVESTRQTQMKLERLKKFIDTVHSW